MIGLVIGVEEVAHLLVRLVVATGGEVDDPAGVSHLGEHAVGRRLEDHAFSLGHARLGAVDVATEREVDRLRDDAGRFEEGLPRLDDEPLALVEVRSHRRQHPEVRARERVHDQRPGEKPEAALVAE